LIYGLVGVLTLNFLLAKFKVYQRKHLRLLPPLLTFGAFWVFFSGQELSYLDSTFHVGGLTTIVLPFLGVIAFDLVTFKAEVVKKMFGTNESLVEAIMPFFIGVAVLIGAFNALGFGVFLVAAGYLAASFYRSEGSKQIVYSLLAISLIWMFGGSTDSAGADLQVGKTLMGLFFGAFAVMFIQFAWKAEKRKPLLILVGYLLGIGFVYGALMGQTQHASFGGMDAFIGALVGFSLANTVGGKSPIGMSILAFMIAGGLLLPSYLVNEDQQAIEKQLEIFAQPESKDDQPVVIKTLPLSEIVGKYKIDEESAIVSFKLGPKGGVTKGAIRKFTGSVNITEDVINSQFTIQMPVANLTTFNSMRDESVMGSDYLNASKFAMMKFEGKSLTATEIENEYDIQGDFSMLGKTNKLMVRIMRLDDTSGKFLVGTGTIDRTLFGMNPDSREGNQVSFEFKIELK
jgi:polyisoprenoid-binding protein YceI